MSIDKFRVINVQDSVDGTLTVKRVDGVNEKDILILFFGYYGAPIRRWSKLKLYFEVFQ